MTVLIVEDEPEVRELMRVLLRRKGHEVLSAGTDMEARGLWAEAWDRIEVMVCDAYLGAAMGTELCREFKQEKPAVRVILCTGMPYVDVLEEVEVLAKPFSPAEFVRLVEGKTSEEMGKEGRKGTR